ncbi:efflux transporter outer membrane subunit [Kordiimonas aquimaris]|uniref:efflux transporter outer membrane subunit n=1 Tax=Kordiimonas aquimaris TaxID=707591 RepID=UPI0021CFADCB|nr:efflux transporter outer membrane subunit [Kordiimonas aquimaris]
MRLFNSIGLVAVSLALSGCASLNLNSGTADGTIRADLVQSVTDIPEQWQTAQSTVGDVQVGWIDALNDPVLSGLVKEAQSNNRNLQVAAANVERSWTLARQAGVALRPNVGVSLGGNRQAFLDGPVPDTSQFDWGIQASWEADIWGRIRAGQKAAVASAQSVEADYRFTQYSIAAAVANAYFIAIEASLQTDVARKTLETLSDTDRIVNVQYDEGIAMAQDVALSASDVSSTQASLITARGSYRDAINALQVLIGRYPSGDLETRTSLPDVPQMPPTGLPSELLERRPDIIATERNVAASFYALDQVKVANLPRLTLTANTGALASRFEDIFDPVNILVNIAGSITAPLFDGGLNNAQIAQAKAEQKQAVAAYAQTVLTAFQEVETSLNQTRVLRDREEALRQSAKHANRALDIVRIRYNEGETDLIDVLNIQQRVFTAESNLVSAERARLDEWINLNLALGGSW